MFDLVSLIKYAGYSGIAGIVFAESGLFFGFFLPGDSVLFTAGFLASQGYLNIWALIIIVFVSAVTGDSVGYAFGKKVGPKIFTKEDSFFFDKKHVERAHNFYSKHGGKAITLARFIPAVRTFVPIVAGVGKMRYKTFLFWNVIGGLVWGVGMSLLGYFLGATIPGIVRYIVLIVLLIILLSISPAIIHLIKCKEDREKIKLQIVSLFKKKNKV